MVTRRKCVDERKTKIEPTSNDSIPADNNLENYVGVWKRQNNKRPGFKYFHSRNIKRRSQAMQKNAESAATRSVCKNTHEKETFSPHKEDNSKLAQSIESPHQGEDDFKLVQSMYSVSCTREITSL